MSKFSVGEIVRVKKNTSGYPRKLNTVTRLAKIVEASAGETCLIEFLITDPVIIDYNSSGRLGFFDHDLEKF